jgi:hypothetical protein
LKAVFSVGSAPMLYNEDPRPTALMTESWGLSVESWALQWRLRRDGATVELTVEGNDKSSAWAAVTRGPERVKLKNLHCSKPLPGNGCWRHSGLEKA